MDLSHAMMERALILLAAGKRDEASDLFARILLEKPDHCSAWAMRGQIEQEAGRMFNAALHYNAACQINPNQYEIWCNRGMVYAELGMAGLAEDSYRRSIAFKDNISARHNLGNLYAGAMKLPEAVAEYRAALAVRDDAQSHASLGRTLIATGEWAEGWQHYRHRFGAPTYPVRAELPYPLWRGESLEGKTILLYSEQGFGDEILSLRFARKCKNRGARVVLAVRLPMYRIAKTMSGDDVDEVIVQFDKSELKPDYCCALLDVPAHCGTCPSTASGSRRYGYLSGKRPERLALPDGFKVGICWRTGERPLQPETQSVHKANTISIDLLKPLIRPGVVLVSLQKPSPPGLAELGIIDPMKGVQDFADTAWIMEHLDLVISVDTSVAHLAGALGKPVMVLLRHNVIWPWMQEDDRSIWYDSARLYRQKRPGDWKEPISRLMADFDAALAARKAA